MSRLRDKWILGKEVQVLKGITTAIREEIAAHGLSIIVVARGIGIGRQTLSRKLNGHVDFSVSELTAIANFLGTTVAELMRRADQISANGQGEASSEGFAIQDEASGTVVLQARHIDLGGVGGDAA
mgnify:CR=1 FL=1